MIVAKYVLSAIFALVLGPLVGTSSTFSASASMLLGERTAQPIGHHEFCRTYPEDCRSREAAAPSTLSTDDWRFVREANAKINKAISPASDMEMHGREEVWSYPTTKGDCEDYALLKRRLLKERGIPNSNLLMTVVKKPDGEGHAVLTIRTDKGDFVLDNLKDQVRPWQEFKYTFVKIQDPAHGGRWRSLDNLVAETPVAATNN